MKDWIARVRIWCALSVVIAAICWAPQATASAPNELELASLCDPEGSDTPLDSEADGAVGVFQVHGARAHAFHIGSGYWVSVLHTARGRSHRHGALYPDHDMNQEDRRRCDLIGTSGSYDIALYQCADTEERACINLDSSADLVGPGKLDGAGDSSVLYVSDVVSVPVFQRNGLRNLQRRENLEYGSCHFDNPVLVSRFVPDPGQSGAPLVFHENEELLSAHLDGMVIARIGDSRGVILPGEYLRNEIAEILSSPAHDTLSAGFRSRLFHCGRREDEVRLRGQERVRNRAEQRARCIDDVDAFIKGSGARRFNRNQVSAECRSLAGNLLWDSNLRDIRNLTDEILVWLDTIKGVDGVVKAQLDFWIDAQKPMEEAAGEFLTRLDAYLRVHRGETTEDGQLQDESQSDTETPNDADTPTSSEEFTSALLCEIKNSIENSDEAAFIVADWSCDDESGQFDGVVGATMQYLFSRFMKATIEITNERRISLLFLLLSSHGVLELDQSILPSQAGASTFSHFHIDQYRELMRLVEDNERVITPDDLSIEREDIGAREHGIIVRDQAAQMIIASLAKESTHETYLKEIRSDLASYQYVLCRSLNEFSAIHAVINVDYVELPDQCQNEH